MRTLYEKLQRRAQRRGRPPRILIIRPAGIGDIVMSLPMLPNLRAAFPDAQIHFLTEAPSVPILKALPEVNEVLLLDKRQMGALIGTIRRNRYDVVFDLYQNPRTMWLSLLSGARWRVSFDRGSRRWAYQVRTPYTTGKYHLGKTLDMLAGAGIPVLTRLAQYPLPADLKPQAEAILEQALPGHTGVLGILPTGGWPSKRCDSDKLAELSAAIATRYQLAVLLMGGPAEADILQEVGRYLDQLDIRWAIAPKTDIVLLGSVLRACRIVIGNDSGPTHIAATTGVPTIVLYGPSLPQMLEYQRGTVACIQLTREQLDCIQCELGNCPRQHECFRWLEPVLIQAEAARVLAE